MEETHLRLSITLKMTISSKLSDYLANQEGLEHRDVIPEKELEQELIIKRFVHCQTVWYIGNVATDLSYLIVFVIWMYRCHQINTALQKIALFNSRSHQRKKSGTPARFTMLPIYVIFSITAMSISTMIGLLTNSFIIVVHGMDRAKGRNVNPRELVLFILGLFNIAFQCTMAANDTVLFFWSDLYYSDNVYTIFSVLLLFTIFSSFWFTLCLCGFYYVMLVTSEHTFLMRLKQCISEVVPWILASFIFLSLAISIPVVWNIKVDYPSQINGNSTFNVTVEHTKPHMSLLYLLITSIIGCSIPLFLVAVTNILIIKSLCFNANSLGKSSGGMNMQSVEASVSAAWTVTSLLLLYFSFYVSEIMLFTFHRYNFKDTGAITMDSLWFSVCLVVVYAYSPVQSLILICGSPKLKRTSLRLIGSIICDENKPTTSEIFTLQCNKMIYSHTIVME
ncbi:taste receptor type 2 member 40-like [Discoglossus pictus]